MSDRTRSRLLAVPLARIDSHSLPPNTPRAVEGGNERPDDWVPILLFIGMHLAKMAHRSRDASTHGESRRASVAP